MARPSAETLAIAERQREEIEARKSNELNGDLLEQAKGSGDRAAKPDPKPGARTQAEPVSEAAAKRTSKPRAKKGDKLSAKQAAVEILTEHDGPLSLTELQEKILMHPKTKVGGKTPAATIAAMFYVEAKKPGGLFKRTGAKKATFTLR